MLALSLGPARAVEASELIVEWSAPPECPDRAELLTAVERALDGAQGVNLTATARVTHSDGLYRARVQVTSSVGSGERTLENARCEPLLESVALVIALSAPQAAGGRPDAAREELAVTLSVHAGASAGPLPRAALGAGGTLGVEGPGALRFELGGSYFAGQSSTFDETRLGARFQLLAFGVRACRIWVVGAFELGPCLGAELHRIAGQGFGGMISSDGTALMWGPAAAVLGRLRLLAPLALGLSLQGAVPLARRRFVFSDVGALHRPSAVAFQLSVGPEVRL